MAHLTCHWCIHVRVPPNRMHSRWRNWATRTTYVLGAAPALAIRLNMTKLHVPGCENAQIQHVWPKTKYLFACVAWESRLRCARYITAPRSRTVLYCIDRPQGEKEGKHGAESTPQISLNFSHIIYIWIESGIRCCALRHLPSLGQISFFSQISFVPNTGVRAIY